MRSRVHVTLEEGVCELVIDNPRRKNALSLSLLDELEAALADAREGSARVVILAGAGDVFSAGADLADITGSVEDRAVDDAIERVVHGIRSLPAPVIAAIEGPCLGGAVTLALACDALVSSAESYFQVPATRMGLLYNPVAVARMHARLGSAILSRLLLFGEELNAESAARAGFVACVVSTGCARDRAWELARQASMGAPNAVAVTKSLLVALEGGETQLDRWNRIYADILGSPERGEAVAATKKRFGLN